MASKFYTQYVSLGDEDNKPEITENPQEAVWVDLIPPDGNGEIVTINTNGGPHSFLKVKAAINAFSDLHMMSNRIYNPMLTEPGLHVYAQKDAGSDDVERLAAVNENYSGDFCMSPDPELCFRGWAFLTIENENKVFDPPTDMRDKADFETDRLRVEQGLKPVSVDSRYKVAYKHANVDRSLKGKTLRVKVAALRDYWMERTLLWKIRGIEDRLAKRAELLQKFDANRRVFTPAYYKKRARLASDTPDVIFSKEVDRKTGEITVEKTPVSNGTLLIGVYQSNEQVNLFDVPAGSYLMSNRRGRILGFNPRDWDPQDPGGFYEEWAAAAEAGFRIVLN